MKALIELAADHQVSTKAVGQVFYEDGKLIIKLSDKKVAAQIARDVRPLPVK